MKNHCIMFLQDEKSTELEKTEKEEEKEKENEFETDGEKSEEMNKESSNPDQAEGGSTQLQTPGIQTTPFFTKKDSIR